MGLASFWHAGPVDFSNAPRLSDTGVTNDGTKKFRPQSAARVQVADGGEERLTRGGKIVHQPIGDEPCPTTTALPARRSGLAQNHRGNEADTPGSGAVGTDQGGPE